ncbi:dol-P-Man:Man(6)GlcNAc(2)-PP-Dol alpha-1,2-mannosyltransferase [Rosa sericea]
MALSTRQRRPQPSDPSSSSSPSPSVSYTKVDKQGKSGGVGVEKGFSWFVPLCALGMLRYMSATSNIIHDCDEVFNYWEPLHYLLYKSGFQTWEYSSQFALRSYLYILFHELVGRPASLLFGEEKVRVFYAVRIFLGLISVVTETILVYALSRKYGKRLASYTLAMLCLTSGCFFASTSFLPSSFSMYAVSLSSGLFLLDKPAMAVSVAAAGVIFGWPFSILVFLPLTFYSLARRFKQAFIAGAATSIVVLALSVLVDYSYYSRWTSSVLNLLIYNVAGGGESHLYGTEGPLFYLRNGFNNFNFCFVLALLFLVMLPIAKKKYAPDLLIVVSPIYIWLAFMSLQPHKEERFLYPIYPLICVAASAVIESFPDVFRSKYNPHDNSILVVAAKILRPVVLSLILCASHARTFSLINGYSAPIEIYKLLEHHEDAGPGSVLCVGSEWHRFPSSFFVPDYVGEVRWIDDGFRGLLPFPFNSTLGGTAAAPPYLNNKNKASDEQYLRDLEHCTFLVELELSRPFPSRGSDSSTWEVIAALPYLDRELSPAKYRSFFIPYVWMHKNIFGMYKLLRRIPK